MFFLYRNQHQPIHRNKSEYYSDEASATNKHYFTLSKVTRSLTSFTSSLFSDVCTKYQEASKIINLALQGIVAQCLPGASIIDISEFGRTVIVSQSAKLFTKKVAGQVVDRGVAFPVCISVNDIVCNHAPLESSEEKVSYSFIAIICTPK
jgi:hypothetical protein